MTPCFMLQGFLFLWLQPNRYIAPPPPLPSRLCPPSVEQKFLLFSHPFKEKLFFPIGDFGAANSFPTSAAQTKKSPLHGSPSLNPSIPPSLKGHFPFFCCINIQQLRRFNDLGGL